MYARIIQVPLQPGSITAATAYFHDSVGPALKSHQGFLEAHFLTSAATSQGQMETFWATEADRQAAESNGFLQGVLSAMKPYFAGEPTVAYYEVGVQVR